MLKYVPVVSDAIALHCVKNAPYSDSNALRRAIISCVNDFMFTCSSDLFAEKFAKKDNVYAYYFTYRSQKKPLLDKCNGWMGACHAEELLFVFGLPLKNPQDYDQVDYQFSLDVIKAWTDFAKTGYDQKNAKFYHII